MSARKRGCLSTRQPWLEAEVCQHELRRLERAVAVAERRPHAGVAEADDVGAAVAGDVGQEARVLVDAPAPASKPRSASTNLRCLERAVAVAERRPHAGVAEADDVGAAVAGDVGQEARVLLHPPALASKPRSASTNCAAWNEPSPLLSAVHTPASPKPTMSARPSPVMSARKRGCFSTRQPWLEAEVRQHELRRLERAVAVAQRRPHAGVSEADDVGACRHR